MSIKTKKKVICHVPTANQFEDIKPIEVKCFLNDNQITIETEKQQTDVTATMMTIVPQSKRSKSAPIKKPIVTTVTDMMIVKPIRHLAILPSSKEQSTKGFLKHSTNLSETFTMYDGPATTPNVNRSLDDTLTMNNQNQMSDLNFEIPINIELNTDNINLCDNTTVSSICELVDQPKLEQKPHSLIGRYQLPNANTSTKPPPPPPPSVHVATVYYGETQPPEADNKQILIQQFYTQLEKMKATFNTDQPEQSRQITTNTLTFNDGQVKQTSATNQLKEKMTMRQISSATVLQNNKKPPIPKKQKTTKIPASRIQSAPVTMATQSTTVRNPNPISLCKKRQNEKIPVQQKKSLQTKDKQTRRIESAPPNQIEIRPTEVTLLPHDEQECRQMYEKLQRLQPNGVCVDMNTLRRALYPPVGTTTYSSNINYIQTSSHRQRTEEIPQSWIKVDDKYVSQYVATHQTKSEVNSNESTLVNPIGNTNIDRIADQLKKHAAINYSYYTRTK